MGRTPGDTVSAKYAGEERLRMGRFPGKIYSADLNHTALDNQVVGIHGVAVDFLQRGLKVRM